MKTDACSLGATLGFSVCVPPPWAAKLGLEAYNHAAEVKVRAERKAGEMLAQLERGKTGPKELSNKPLSNSPYREVLQEHGINDMTASRWQQLAVGGLQLEIVGLIWVLAGTLMSKPT